MGARHVPHAGRKHRRPPGDAERAPHLGRQGILDGIRHVDEAGRINFRGAAFRTYLPDRDRWYVLWMMANVEGHTELEARVVAGEVHTMGKGRDPMGELMEKGRHHDIAGDGYSFTLERSNDGGRTWIRPFVAFRATRRQPAR
jgi:hypothetical protein